MKSTGRKAWTPFLRAVVVIGVIACLCFSAGEGLRLTPLPSAPLEEVSSSGLRINATLTRGTARHLTGPLDLPAQGHVQKRSKRQTPPDWECPPSGHISESFFFALLHSSSGDHVAPASHIPDLHPPGRAPPLIS